MRTALATPDDMKEYQDSHDVNHFSQKNFPELFYLPIGKWFNTAFENHIDKCDFGHYKNTKSVCLVMQFFKLLIIPDYLMSKDLDKCLLWICMQYNCCKKKLICVKASQSLSSHLCLKSPTLCGFHMFFSYERIENDKWHQQNSDWTVCNQ